jgi:hypothetical protein
MMLKSAWGKSEDSSVQEMNTGDAKWQGDLKTTFSVLSNIWAVVSQKLACLCMAGSLPLYVCVIRLLKAGI